MSETVKGSCGCVFCDIGVKARGGVYDPHHLLVSGQFISCTKPTISDNIAKIEPYDPDIHGHADREIDQ